MEESHPTEVCSDDNGDDGFIDASKTSAHRRHRHTKKKQTTTTNQRIKQQGRQEGSKFHYIESPSSPSSPNTIALPPSFVEQHNEMNRTQFHSLVQVVHSTRVQNHILTSLPPSHDELVVEYRFKLTVGRLSAIQGYSTVIGDESCSVLLDGGVSINSSNNSNSTCMQQQQKRSWTGHFPVGSQICLHRCHKQKNDGNCQFIKMQLRYKTLNEKSSMSQVLMYRPVFHTIVNMDHYQKQHSNCSSMDRSSCDSTVVKRQRNKKSENGSSVLYRCFAILMHRCDENDDIQLLLGNKLHSDHFTECMNGIDHYFREQGKLILRHKFLCNERALHTWSYSELELIANYLPLDYNHRDSDEHSDEDNDDEKECVVYRSAWKKYWLLNETLFVLSEMALDELNKRRRKRRKELKCEEDLTSPSSHFWTFPSDTCACIVQDRQYRFESNVETVRRALNHETGICLSDDALNSSTIYFDHTCDQTVERNTCFDRFFIIPSPEKHSAQSIAKRGYSHWKWISMSHILNDDDARYYSSHLKSIVGALKQKLLTTTVQQQ